MPVAMEVHCILEILHPGTLRNKWLHAGNTVEYG